MTFRLWLTLKKILFLSTLRQRIIGPHVSHVLTDSYNGKLLVPASDFCIGNALAFQGEYDRNHIEKLLGLVDKQSSVLFVGAHVGTYVIPISKTAREVVAIEANPATFETLQMNLMLNGCHNVRALNFAALDKWQKIQFLASRRNSGGSKIVPPCKREEFLYDRPETIEVQAAPLDELLHDSSPSHIVMDIEGAEAKAIAGMPRLLASSKFFIVEFLPNHIENVAGISCEEFLQRLPFKHIELLDDPQERNIIEAARSRYYYGSDLLCSH